MVMLRLYSGANTKLLYDGILDTFASDCMTNLSREQYQFFQLG